MYSQQLWHFSLRLGNSSQEIKHGKNYEWRPLYVAFYVVHNCQKYQVVSPRDTLMTNDVSQGHGDTHLGLRCLCPTVYS